MKINYYCPVNELSAHLGRLLLQKKPLCTLFAKDKAHATSLARVWIQECLDRVDTAAREKLGTPLFPTQWDGIDAEISLDEWWVLHRMELSRDLPTAAADHGFASIAEFARHAELAWRLTLASMILNPPLKKLRAWREGLHN